MVWKVREISPSEEVNLTRSKIDKDHLVGFTITCELCGRKIGFPIVFGSISITKSHKEVVLSCSCGNKATSITN